MAIAQLTSHGVAYGEAMEEREKWERKKNEEGDEGTRGGTDEGTRDNDTVLRGLN